MTGLSGSLKKNSRTRDLAVPNEILGSPGLEEAGLLKDHGASMSEMVQQTRMSTEVGNGGNVSKSHEPGVDSSIVDLGFADDEGSNFAFPLGGKDGSLPIEVVR